MGRKRYDLTASPVPAPAAPPPLTVEMLEETSLKDRINKAHSQVQLAEAAALPYAREAGQALLEVKGRLSHGEFIPWLQQNCTVSPRRAQQYMAIATNWAAIEAFQKTNRGSLLSIRGALEVLKAQPTQTALPAAEEARPTFTKWHSMTLATDALDRLTAAAEAQNRKPEDLAAELLEKAIARLG